MKSEKKKKNLPKLKNRGENWKLRFETVLCKW